MKKIKQWFFDRFLPMWAKETVLKENRKLQRENEILMVQLAEKQAYIDGLLVGMKNQRRIIINTTEGKR